MMSNVSIPSPEYVAPATGDELIRFALVMPRDEQLEPLFYDVQRDTGKRLKPKLSRLPANCTITFVITWNYLRPISR